MKILPCEIGLLCPYKNAAGPDDDGCDPAFPTICTYPDDEDHLGETTEEYEYLCGVEECPIMGSSCSPLGQLLAQMEEVDMSHPLNDRTIKVSVEDLRCSSN